MESPLLIALSRQDVLRRRIDVLANNLANMNTTGFKRQELVAEDAPILPPGETRPLQFVLDRATWRDDRAGPLQHTDNALDVAVQGDAWLSVQTAEGKRYTRAGAFTLNSEGELTTASGDKVLLQGDAPAVLPTGAQNVQIKGDGTISTELGQVGKLQLTRFENPQALDPDQSGYFMTDEAGQTDENSHVVQGVIEASNVQPVVEMTRMIEALRSYQQTQRMLETETERQRNAVRQLGRVS